MSLTASKITLQSQRTAIAASTATRPFQLALRLPSHPSSEYLRHCLFQLGEVPTTTGKRKACLYVMVSLGQTWADTSTDQKDRDIDVALPERGLKGILLSLGGGILQGAHFHSEIVRKEVFGDADHLSMSIPTGFKVSPPR